VSSPIGGEGIKKELLQYALSPRRRREVRAEGTARNVAVFKKSCTQLGNEKISALTLGFEL
jgi:hypothetical protein